MSEKFDIFTIKTNGLKPEPGKVLISEPFLPDYYFNRSVVLLVEHNEDGSLGVVMNKPSTEKVSDVIQDFPKFDSLLYLGGPVETEEIFFIHTRPDLFENSHEVNDELSWGGDVEELKELILLDLIKPHEVRIFLGYSGWNEDQLLTELKENSWLVSDFPTLDLMNTHAEILWKESVRTLGANYKFWLNFPINPELN